MSTDVDRNFDSNPMVRYSVKPKTNLRASPVLFPIPKANRHIIRTGKDIGLRWMDSDASDVIAVRIPAVDLFMCVVVEDAKLHVVRSCNHIVLSSNKLGSTNYPRRKKSRLVSTCSPCCRLNALQSSTLIAKSISLMLLKRRHIPS